MAEFTEGVDTVSTLEASNLVELAAQSSGRILELKIRQGDEVVPGQLLVVLDQAQQQALLAEDRAKAETAKANFDRYTYLSQTGAASQKELDRYRTQYIAAVEKVKSTEATLSYNNLDTLLRRSHRRRKYNESIPRTGPPRKNNPRRSQHGESRHPDNHIRKVPFPGSNPTFIT